MLSQIYEAFFRQEGDLFHTLQVRIGSAHQEGSSPYILKEHRNRWYVIGRKTVSEDLRSRQDKQP